MPRDIQNTLVEMIKAAGQELIDKAEAIAGNPVGPYIEYKITIDIKTDTEELNLPVIKVNRSFISEYATSAKLKLYMKMPEV